MLQKWFKQFNAHSLSERIGLGLSFVCVVHCILTPVFIALLPVMSSTVFANPAFEIILLALSFLITGAINIIGFMKHHKKYAPLATMLLGFSFIISGHVTHHHIAEAILATIGGLLLAYSIYLNRKKKQQASKVACC
ncbi:MAG: MerC domain-containing protein [Saprospiraceae bacterium]|nr:MerC domain-containing protein [Saprospiraceae bacterium]